MCRWKDIREAFGDETLAHRNISINLEIPCDFPRSTGPMTDSEHLDRWDAEKVTFFTLPSAAFTSTRKGKTLPSSLESDVKRFLTRGSTCILEARYDQEPDEASAVECLKDSIKVY